MRAFDVGLTKHRSYCEDLIAVSPSSPSPCILMSQLSITSCTFLLFDSFDASVAAENILSLNLALAAAIQEGDLALTTTSLKGWPLALDLGRFLLRSFPSRSEPFFPCPWRLVFLWLDPKSLSLLRRPLVACWMLSLALNSCSTTCSKTLLKSCSFCLLNSWDSVFSLFWSLEGSRSCCPPMTYQEVSPARPTPLLCSPAARNIAASTLPLLRRLRVGSAATSGGSIAANYPHCRWAWQPR